MSQLFRGTFFMEGMSQGWSESYTFQQADGLGVREFLSVSMDPLANLRAALLAREYKLTAFRATKIRDTAGAPVRRNSDLVISPRGPGGTTLAWAGCQPRECVVVNGVTTDGAREKKVFMRGIPDDIIQKGGILNRSETIGWFSRLDSWFARLRQETAGWLIDLEQGLRYNVSNYTINPNLTQQITFTGTIFLGVPIGTRVRVRLSRINGKSRLNGIQILEVASPTSGVTISPLALGEYTAGGSGVRLLDPKPFVFAQQWDAEIARTHDTGKVSVGTRGRQSATPRV